MFIGIAIPDFLRHILHLVFVVALISIIYHGHSDVVNYAVKKFEVLVPMSPHCDDPPKPRDLPKLHAPFVGRESNMSYLERVLLADSVQVVGINGPPGFGKSTLAIHLGWKMVKNCFTVGYIDLEERDGILSYVVTGFNERRLAAWRPPMELTYEDFEEDAVLVSNGLEWFNNEALLIVDNCDRVLSDEKHRKELFRFLEILIRCNNKGKILLTSEEQLDLYSKYYKDLNFALGNLSLEASVELLKQESPEISSDNAEELAIAVENCPIALSLIGRLLRRKKPKELIKKLGDRKGALLILNKTEHKDLNFISVMDVALGFLGRKERMSAMFTSFFPGHFSIDTATKILMQSDHKYNLNAGIVNGQGAMESIEELERRSLLETSSFFGEIMRYRMHRLIKVYFMDKGEGHHTKMEVDFNSSFRIYFSELGVRRQPEKEIRSRVENELLSNHDKCNLEYLIEMLLSSFGSHLYSENELIYLAFAFSKGLIHFDHLYFQTLLELYTHPPPRVATLPLQQDWTEAEIAALASDFNNFFVNVLCEITSRDVCVNVYFDILFKIYEKENCNETFEDNLEESCRMVNCDYADDYFEILNQLDAFDKCSDVTFCNLLYNVHYMCSAHKLLLSPLMYALLSFILLLCVNSIVMMITCFKVRKVPFLLWKHFCFLLLIYFVCVVPTYTLVFRKYIGLYFDAPLEVHARNLIGSVAIIFYVIVVFFRMLIYFLY